MGVSMFKHVVAISRSTLCIFVLLSLPVRWEKAEVSTSQGNFGRVWDMKFQCQCEQVWSVLESAHCLHFPYWCARLLFNHETLSWRHLQHHSCGCKHPKLGACAHEHHNFCWLVIEGVILFGLCGTIMTWYLLILLEPVLTNPHEWYTRTWFIGSLLLCKTMEIRWLLWIIMTILRAAKCETHATLGLTENRVLIPLNPMLYHALSLLFKLFVIVKLAKTHPSAAEEVDGGVVEVLCFSCRRAKDSSIQKSMVAFLKKVGRTMRYHSWMMLNVWITVIWINEFFPLESMG